MNTRAKNHFFKKCVTFSELSVSDGGRTSIIQVLRTGEWDHPVYGRFSVTTSDLDEFVANFKANVRGVDLAVDVNHDPEHKAVGWYREVYREGEALFATIEWTDEGLDQITSKAFRYFSPELFFSYRDEESGKELRNVLIGGGITNRPFFKGMQALKMSETENAGEGAGKSFYILNSTTMKKNFTSIFSELNALEKIGTAALEEAKLAFNELPEADQATEKANLETLEAKHDETVDATDAAAAEAAKTAETAADAEKATENAALQASETVESAVFKETGLSMSEIKDMQRKFSELEKAQKFAETEKKVSGFVFSESNKTGIVLPKAAQKFAEFASKLPDSMAKEFFDLLASKSFRVIELGEVGAQGGDGLEFNVPAETPANTTRESFVLDHVAKAFQEKDKSLSYEKAMVSALKHIETNGIK